MNKSFLRPYIVSSDTKKKMSNNKISKEKWDEIVRQANLLNKKDFVKK